MGACAHCGHLSLGLRVRAWWGRNWGVVATLVAMVMVAGAFVVYAMTSFVCVIPPIHTTRLKLKGVENALRQYSIDNGYPAQEQGLAALVDPPGGEIPYLKELPQDAWQQPIIYVAPDTLKARQCRSGLAQPKPFMVYSRGPDGIAGTDDDIFAKRKRRTRT